MDMLRFVRRKQWCEEQLRLAEPDPNFSLLRRTHGVGQIDRIRGGRGSNEASRHIEPEALARATFSAEG